MEAEFKRKVEIYAARMHETKAWSDHTTLVIDSLRKQVDALEAKAREKKTDTVMQPAISQAGDITQLLQLLKSLQNQAKIEEQSEEYRKKYENYKKLYTNETADKAAKVREIQILKDEAGQVSDVKELRAKYENLKILYGKEQNIRREKEAKNEQLADELDKKSKSLNAMYPEIDKMCEMNSEIEEQVSKLEEEKTALEAKANEEERRRIQAELNSTQKDMKINELKNEAGPGTT